MPSMGANQWGTQPPVREPVCAGSIVKLLGEGNCGSVADRGDEAGVQRCEPANKNGMCG